LIKRGRSLTKFSLAVIVRYLEAEYSIKIEPQQAAFILGMLMKYEKIVDKENEVD